MMQTDPTLAKIAAQFTKFDIQPSRGAYMVVDRRTSNPIARLRPIPDTDRFELFYWSNAKDRWTFGNMGRVKLMLKSAHEIVEKRSDLQDLPVGPAKMAKVKLSRYRR
jgi:hypothetical protein